MSKIPVKNIYYMLCYAWDILDEAGKLNIDKDSYDQEINLLGKMLNSGLKYQLNRGLHHDYLEETETISGIKGKINFSESIQKATFKNAKAVCSFDTFSSNNIHNQLIKAALFRVLKSEKLDHKIALDTKQSLQLLSHVDNIEFNPRLFNTLKIPINHPFYRYLLSVSEFILTNTAQKEGSGNYHFSDFLKDEHKMRKLYEKFVFNFYKTEMRDDFSVRSNHEKYSGLDSQGDDSSYIPELHTDIELTNIADKKLIIIDTKFSQETLTQNMFGQEKMHSKYLMQLMTYLENRRRSTGEIASGILLYPTVDKHYEFTNKIWDYHVSIFNINLNEDWTLIRDNLIRIISDHRLSTTTSTTKEAA